MPSVARLSRACAVWPGCPAQLGVMCSPSQRLAAWWLGAIARTGKGGSFVSRGVPCRVVGTSRHLRLLRVPASGAGDGFPRRTLLITARGYCSALWGGGCVGRAGADPGICERFPALRSKSLNPAPPSLRLCISLHIPPNTSPSVFNEPFPW